MISRVTYLLAWDFSAGRSCILEDSLQSFVALKSVSSSGEEAHSFHEVRRQDIAILEVEDGQWGVAGEPFTLEDVKKRRGS